MFMKLRQLIYVGRAGDSMLLLEQQLEEALECIAAKYGKQASSQPYLAYFKVKYMEHKSKSADTLTGVLFYH